MICPDHAAEKTASQEAPHDRGFDAALCQLSGSTAPGVWIEWEKLKFSNESTFIFRLVRTMDYLQSGEHPAKIGNIFFEYFFAGKYL